MNRIQALIQQFQQELAAARVAESQLRAHITKLTTSYSQLAGRLERGDQAARVETAKRLQNLHAPPTFTPDQGSDYEVASAPLRSASVTTQAFGALTPEEYEEDIYDGDND